MFRVGTVVMTQGVAELKNQGLEVGKLLSRHMAGDWGDLDAFDIKENNRALKDGDRLLSAYETEHGKIWIISEWDRSVTTLLLPSEY